MMLIEGAISLGIGVGIALKQSISALGKTDVEFLPPAHHQIKLVEI
jgi:hypothetical protein